MQQSLSSKISHNADKQIDEHEGRLLIETFIPPIFDFLKQQKNCTYHMCHKIPNEPKFYVIPKII